MFGHTITHLVMTLVLSISEGLLSINNLTKSLLLLSLSGLAAKALTIAPPVAWLRCTTDNAWIVDRLPQHLAWVPFFP